MLDFVMGMGAMVLLACAAGLTYLLVLVHKILEGVNSILDAIQWVSEEVDTNEGNLHGPADVPTSPSLMDLLHRPPKDDSGTGSFRGKQGWEPPPPPDEKV